MSGAARAEATPGYALHTGRGSSHRLLAQLVVREHRPPVLDVGAAEGYLGRLLAGSGIPIDAVEPNARMAAAARPYYRQLFTVPIEDVPEAPGPEHRYGTIVCGDVLEHLVDPSAVLKQIGQRLLPDGVVLISLPNAVHLAVRLLVLIGHFPKMDRGPLDRTHLHFFTRSTAEALITGAGFAIQERHPTVVPLPDVLGARWRPFALAAQPLQLALVRLLPELLAYQWVFVARRSGAQP